MSLHDVIISDASAVFCNEADFAEEVTYITRDEVCRTISAIVDRDALALLQEDGDNVIPSFVVHVQNSDTAGISSDELNLGGDSLAFSARVGEEVSRRSITRLLNHDEGMLLLECR